MTTIKATVSGTQIDLQTTGQLTSGMIGVPVSFSFDPDWDGRTKTVVFRAGAVSRDVIGIEAECTVPWEVLQQESYVLQIGVYGCNNDGSIVIPTVWADAGLICPGADPSGDPGTDPQLPVWQQVLAKLHAGDLQGPQGEPGPAGDDGYTPQKGVDYYTEAEKTELVSAVLSALPTYNGEVESL